MKKLALVISIGIVMAAVVQRVTVVDVFQLTQKYFLLVENL